MNKIYVLGIGPGSRDYLLPTAEKVIQKADVLLGGRRVLKQFEYLKKINIPITVELEKVRDFIKENYEDKQIVVLVSGDTGLFSLLDYLKKYFREDELEVIPGISSIQLAFARAKMTWHDAEIISLHGKDNKEKLLKAVKEYKKVGVLIDHNFPPQLIADFLLKNGINDKKGIVCEELSYPTERVINASLEELCQMRFTPLSVMVIIDE